MSAPLHYFDTSAIVPAFVREPTTERVQALIGAQGGENLAISAWTLTEFSSALALKLRTGAIAAETFASVLAEWTTFTASVGFLEVDDRAFRDAAALCQRHDLGLRAGDALHLAIAAAHGCTLVTLDARLAKAAPELGVPVAEV